jgi:hypothetical protein
VANGSAFLFGRRPNSRISLYKCDSSGLEKIQLRFNAAELSLIKITKYPGFQVARAVLQTRQIQQHASLGLVDEMVLRGNPAS